MKKWLSAIFVLLVFSTGMLIMGSQNKAEVRFKWVKPGEEIYEFPYDKYLADYKTTLYYSTYDVDKAILEVRIEKNGGYLSKDSPVSSWPIELKLQIGHQVVLGNTVDSTKDSADNSVRIEVVSKQAERIKIKIYC